MHIAHAACHVHRPCDRSVGAGRGRPPGVGLSQRDRACSCEGGGGGDRPGNRGYRHVGHGCTVYQGSHADTWKISGS